MGEDGLLFDVVTFGVSGIHVDAVVFTARMDLVRFLGLSSPKLCPEGRQAHGSRRSCRRCGRCCGFCYACYSITWPASPPTVRSCIGLRRRGGTQDQRFGRNPTG